MTARKPTHILIHYFSPGRGPEPGTPEHDVEMREWEAIHDELHSTGTLLGGYSYQLDGLTLTEDGVTEGAITDPVTGEVSFAVHVIRVPHEDAAVAVAQAMPTTRYGRVEIRKLM